MVQIKFKKFTPSGFKNTFCFKDKGYLGGGFVIWVEHKKMKAFCRMPCDIGNKN